MEWIATCHVTKAGTQSDTPKTRRLGIVKAADKDSALFVARIEYGDRLGLQVQSVNSASLADDAHKVVKKQRVKPLGYHNNHLRPIHLPWDQDT